MARNELKFYLSPGDDYALSRTMSCLLQPDDHNPDKGGYFIRSLYFDDYADSALHDKLAGVPDRAKIRLRLYDLDQEQVKIEIKNKTYDHILKESLWLSRADAEALMAGESDLLWGIEDPLAKKLLFRFKTGLLRPKVVVDYRREAYVLDVNNVRITFDRDVRTSAEAYDIFNPDLPMTPVFDCERTVLEIKFNHFLPQFLADALGGNKAIRSAISKYVHARLPRVL